MDCDKDMSLNDKDLLSTTGSSIHLLAGNDSHGFESQSILSTPGSPSDSRSSCSPNSSLSQSECTSPTQEDIHISPLLDLKETKVEMDSPKEETQPEAPMKCSTNEESESSGETVADQAKTKTKEPEEFTDNRIYVSNIPFSFRDRDLINLFQPFGEVTAVQIVCNERGSKGFGFVTLDKLEGCKKARDVLHGSQVQGRIIEVKHATPRRHIQNGNNTVVNVANQLNRRGLLASTPSIPIGSSPVILPNTPILIPSADYANAMMMIQMQDNLARNNVSVTRSGVYKESSLVNNNTHMNNKSTPTRILGPAESMNIMQQQRQQQQQVVNSVLFTQNPFIVHNVLGAQALGSMYNIQHSMIGALGGGYNIAGYGQGAGGYGLTPQMAYQPIQQFAALNSRPDVLSSLGVGIALAPPSSPHHQQQSHHYNSITTMNHAKMVQDQLISMITPLDTSLHGEPVKEGHFGPIGGGVVKSNTVNLSSQTFQSNSDSSTSSGGLMEHYQHLLNRKRLSRTDRQDSKLFRF